MRVRVLTWRDRRFGDRWRREVQDRWEYADFLATPAWRRDWISFDCLCYDPATETVFCGVTSFDADILIGWRRREDRWIDPGYARVADRYDAKFHRALLRDPRDGCLYGAPALLHDIDRFHEAPGASIVRYDPRTGDIAKLGLVMPHVYVQALVLDPARDVLYAQTFTPEWLVSYGIAAREARCIGLTGSGLTMAQGENIALDDEGRVWGVWTVTRAWQSTPGPDAHRFYRYVPGSERIEYLDRGLPRDDGAPGYARPEAFFNLGTGCLYVSGDGGALYRLEPQTGQSQRLFQPIDPSQGRSSRLAALALGPDGRAYGVVGRDGRCELLRFDPRAERYDLLGTVQDAQSGEGPWQVHDVCVTPDGVIYAAENDNPTRSSYLWEIAL